MKGKLAFVLNLFFTFCVAEKQCSPYHYDEQIFAKVERLEVILKRMENKLDSIAEDTSVKVCTECPRNWLKFRTSCYLIVDNIYSFIDARTNCQRHGADLVHINGGAENEFLRQHLKSIKGINYLIGLEDTDNEGVFKWVDDNTTPTFTDWSPGQPDNYKEEEDCAVVQSRFNYKWNDGNCLDNFGSICEMKAKVKS